MSRGQASVELVGAALLICLVALGLAQLVLVWQAADRAHRMADQAAVAVAEGRRPPAGLGSARLRVESHRLRVTVPVPVVIGVGSFTVSATATVG